jgi:hypothetical protein
MGLSSGQLAALENLAAKQSGQDVGWISIAAAREITDLGLAERHGGGWKITAAGQAAIKALHDGPNPTPPDEGR